MIQSPQKKKGKNQANLQFWEDKMKKEAKSYRIYIRVSEAEKAEIAYQAALNNMSISEYILKCVRRKRIVVCENFPELLYQLSALGNNLNQIAAIANTNKYISSNQIESAKIFYPTVTIKCLNSFRISVSQNLIQKILTIS